MFVRKSGPPKLRGKAAEVHHLHKVILQLWLRHYNEHIAVHRQILLLLRLNSKIEDLLGEYRQDVALPPGAAKDLLIHAPACVTFKACYMTTSPRKMYNYLITL
jgi:hypothetical protein